MSIDYALLRALAEYASPGPWRTDEHPYMDGQSVYNADGATIAQHLSGNNAELVVLAPDMARELLRLRDGAQRALRVLEQSSPSKGLHARIILTDLLDGDTE